MQLEQFDENSEQWRRWYQRWRKRTVHPELRNDFFHTINTREKAYWLGFLYADGFLRRNTGGTVYIGIELSRKDEERIDQFCQTLGLNKDKKTYRVRYGAEYVAIRYACKVMSNDLIMHGITFHKSRIIEYPRLSNKESELAFLLGYYDGDGQQNTTRIISGSIRFLQEIKQRFGLPYKILTYTQDKEIHGRKTWGTKHVMSLGAELLCEMMRNYEQSMPRKRWFPCTKEEAAHRTREALTSERIRKRRKKQIQWRAITESKLQKLVWSMPVTHVAKEYNVHYKTVVVKCDKMSIVRPPHNYW